MLARLLSVAAILLLAGCAGDPGAMGITGPGTQAVPAPARNDGEASSLGATQAGTYYGASTGPTTGTHGFWGYNE